LSSIGKSPSEAQPGAFSAPHDAHRKFIAVPHCAQNFRPSRFSAAHFGHHILRAQLIEQCLGVFQVGGIEALVEAALLA
jgi:hypothetical protein